jgi:hypothetical protein
MSLARTVAQLLRKNLPSSLARTVRVGDPGKIDASILPAIFVTEMQAVYEVGSTMTDEITAQLLIQVVIDKRQMLGSNREPEDYLDEVVHGEDENRRLRQNTVIGVLRYHYTINGYTIGNQLTYSKDEFPRDERFVTLEGHVELSLTREVNVMNRL